MAPEYLPFSLTKLKDPFPFGQLNYGDIVDVDGAMDAFVV